MTISWRVPAYWFGLLAAAAVMGCSDGSQAGGSADRAAAPVQRGCRVTVNNGRVPPGVKGPPGRAPYFGNGKIWTTLWPRGVVLADRVNVTRNGSIAMKFPWWRGVRGKLKITGRRLDAPAAALRAHIPSGYGAIGFQSTELRFASKGCWEVTGRVGGARLRFVTLVRVKRPRRAKAH